MYMGDFQKLIDFENLYNSCQVSLKGKGKKQSAIRFNVLALENLCVIKRQLIDHTYKLGKYNEFIVSEPKRRVIKSGTFRDKVLQHCLCDYVLLPKMKDVFILDNYAGQVGKGTLFGLNRLTENLLSFYEEHGCKGFILKCDITKFFYSINHDMMKKCVKKYFTDKDIQWVCNLFIDSTDGDGLPLGNQCSQVFALMYLNGLDHLITEKLQCKYYGRYMDDFYLIVEKKTYAIECLYAIKEFISTLRLELNGKTQIIPFKNGIKYCGFHTYITREGKCIRKLTNEKKRAEKKRYRRIAKSVISGKLSRKKFDESYRAFKNHISFGNCVKFGYAMDQMITEILKTNGEV